MTRKRDKIVEALTGTAQIAPEEFSPLTSASRFASLKYAIAGCAYMLRHQKNVRIQVAATLIVTGLTLWLDIDATGWAVLILTVTLVWVGEFINAAIEAAINLASPQLHPMAKVGKDVAAAAVLISVIGSVLVGLSILGPPLLDKLAR